MEKIRGQIREKCDFPSPTHRYSGEAEIANLSHIKEHIQSSV